MMRLFTFSLLVYLAAFSPVNAQVSISVRVSAPSDDLEEYIPGPGQTRTLGTMDDASSDLELGTENRNNADPQLVGMRFANVAIPKGALITRAYLQFTVDNTNKNTDPCELYIFAQAGDNPLTFDPVSLFNLSSRPKLQDSVFWKIADGSWTTIGAAGPEQRSTDISLLVQALVDRNGWEAGNAMAFFITGKGLREVESFDGSPDQAPLLVVEFIPAQRVSQRVLAGSDDLEEYIPGPGQTRTLGTMDDASSDLELGTENRNNADPQIVGIRFTDLNIPKGAVVRNAYLQFTVDNTNKNTDPCELNVFVQDADNTLTFDPNNLFNISSRPKVKDSIFWKIADGSWTLIGEAGPSQRSPNIASLLQAVVNREGWTPGNAMAFFITGKGLREVESFDGSPDQAPLLVVEYINVSSVSTAVSAGSDDLEEYIPGPGQTRTLGTMDDASSDLELGAENRNNADPQLVGIRFTGVNVPKGAIVKNAYLQFTVDNTNKNTDPSELYVFAQADDNPLTFDPNTPFNISSRQQVKDSIAWKIPNGSWTVIGQAGPDQRSPNISALVQAVVNRDGWVAGNAMAFFIKGVGLREAESFDGSPDQAPRLVIEYLSGGSVGNPVTKFPIEAGSSWAYWDKQDAAPDNWEAENFNDNDWTFGPAPLGYGEQALKTEVAKGPVTTYFRKKINLSGLVQLTDSIELHLRVDDGAIVYVNGVEALRVNMASGTATAATPASRAVENDEEEPYFLYDLPKSLFKEGENVIAVEVHQVAAGDADLFFDLFTKEKEFRTNSTALGCDAADDLHISCFTSLIPRAQKDTVQIPAASHVFQYIFSENTPYTKGTGNAPGVFDFTGYVPKNGSSRAGYLSINHEEEPIGGVSILDIRFDDKKGLWVVDTSQAVDFSAVGFTKRNCSGTVTPWNTIITCEEDYGATASTNLGVDTNGDGYLDIGWCVEIDPVTKKIRDYGTGKPQKLWALGRMSHENVVVDKDQRTVYYGEDDGQGSVYKFVADQPANLYTGKLYVLKLDFPFSGGDPTGTTGTWVLVPNTTQQERNDTKKLVLALGATTFRGVEDVEISPLNGQVYFSVKGEGRTYRFTDNGATVSNFETFVGGKIYRINSGNGVVAEDWAGGNDNLTFDDRGNLYVLQDGGRNHVWLVTPDHTQTNPKVELFMQTPTGSEPTGMTFTPDFRYMFISIQGPGGNTLQEDIGGRSEKFDRSQALVVARSPYLGADAITGLENVLLGSKGLRVFPNPAGDYFALTLELLEAAPVQIEIYDLSGRLLKTINRQTLPEGNFRFEFSASQENLAPGMYFVRALVGNQSTVQKLILH